VRIVDLNILLYTVNPAFEQHSAILDWWQNAMSDDETVGLPWPVLTGFIRISTNPHIFPHPLDPVAALEKIETWLKQPNIRLPQETEEHWGIFRSLLVDSGTAGNLTSDAHLAALAISRGAVLVSCDNDFSRFKNLRWLNPLKSR